MDATLESEAAQAVGREQVMPLAGQDFLTDIRRRTHARLSKFKKHELQKAIHKMTSNLLCDDHGRFV